MPEQDRNPDELLLAWHLRTLPHDEMKAVEESLLNDANMRAKSDRLRKILRPLDAWTASSVPLGLAESIVKKVRQRESAASGDRNDHHAPALPISQGYRLIPRVSYREILAAAACVGILVLLAVPGLARMRERAREVVCAGNLGSVFQGLSLYRNEFNGALPYAGSAVNASWLPASSHNGPFASNSRHLFLLAKYHYVPDSEGFVCPSDRDSSPMPAEQLSTYHDFARSRNVSYASMNMSSALPALKPDRQLAYLSDVNPLFVGGRFNESVDPSSANSPAHGGRGQAVLGLDGTVDRLATPLYGTKKDNLWLAGNIQRYTGIETPANDHDAFLVQGFPITDLASPSIRAPLSH